MRSGQLPMGFTEPPQANEGPRFKELEFGELPMFFLFFLR